MLWKDEEDLKVRLYRRIEATVGLNIRIYNAIILTNKD